MDLRIEYPIFLLLFIPVIFYFFFVWKKHRAGWKKLQLTVYSLRVAAVAALIVACTNPYMLLPIEEEQVLFLVDRSASIGEDTDEAVQFVQEAIGAKESQHEVGVYSFAESLQTEAILSGTLDTVPMLSELEKADETNVEEALKLATSIADPKKPARFVLLTDGNETRGDALLQANLMQNSKFSIDVVPIHKTVQQDVVLESFETPRVAFEGEQQQFIMTVHSDSDQEGTVVLYENDERVLEQNVTLQAGSNRYAFNHFSSATGLLKYEAQVIVSSDALLENNKLTSVTTVQAAPKLLVVQSENKPTSIPTIIGQDTIDTTVINSKDLPSMLSSYLPYQAIIFDNVPAHEVGEAKMTVIEQAVKHFGTGFMMVGGDQSFGLGGYYKTPVENLLPVVMDVQGEKEMPSLGLVLVIDRSSSMMGSKMLLAKEAAARSIELLRDDDTLGVIAFDGSPWTIIETEKIKDKEKAKEDVLSIPPGGGTEIYAPLQMAYESLKSPELQRKHIILLTDGRGSANPDYGELVEKGLASGITLSTVAIGNDADQTLLEELSTLGNGRFYGVYDETTIPSILSRETSMMTRTYIVDDPFYPTVYNADKWAGLFEAGVPEMNAYIATTAKPLATVVAESAEEDPVLTTWQYGLGTTIAFASDSSGAWAGGWAGWSNWKKFWQTAIAELLPDYHEVAYAVSSNGNGSYTITDVANEAAFLNVVAVDEDGRELPIQTDVRSASQLNIAVEGDPGLIFLSVTNKDGDVQKIGVQLPYSDEYKIAETNESLLEQLASVSGGKVLEEPADAFREFDSTGFEQRQIAIWLLFIALILFFIDITLRRFGFPHRKTKVADVTVQEEAQSNVGTIVQQLKRERSKR